jgi:cytochrome c biogenesis protein CcmG/thiol:disulfide interchange protein DsbE
MHSTPWPCRFRATRLTVVALAVAASAVAAAPDTKALFDLRVRREGAVATPLGSVLRASPAVVTFWATYCPPCRAEVPVLARAAQRWKAQGVRVVGIAIDVMDPFELKRVATAWGITYESYWLPPDEKPAATRLLGAGVPTTFIVGRGGDVHRLDRVLSDDDLERTLPEHLGLRELPGARGG